MNHFQTRAIVLKRTDYGEADRIITLLTPNHGKFSTLAKGVRKIKSKLAGGVELFTVNDVVIIQGKGELRTLRSSRMHRHFSRLVEEYPRVQAASDVITQINKATEVESEPEYFELLEIALESLNDRTIPIAVAQFWFKIQLLQLQGRTPNFENDSNGEKLSSGSSYRFNAEEGLLETAQSGLGVDHIKFGRLALQLRPLQLNRVGDAEQLASDWVHALA